MSSPPFFIHSRLHHFVQGLLLMQVHDNSQKIGPEGKHGGLEKLIEISWMDTFMEWVSRNETIVAG